MPDRCLSALVAAALLLGAASPAAGQPTTDVYLADLTLFDGVYFVGELTNISNRPDAYDNQPAFTPDSRSVLFTSGFDDGNDGFVAKVCVPKSLG